MKKIFVMALVAIFTGIMFSACEKEDTLVKTKNTLCDKIPSYDQVINDMEESGYCKITDEMISNIIEKDYLLVTLNTPFITIKQKKHIT